MIQSIGLLEVFLFYLAYFFKLINQKMRGIKTNQLGKGKKEAKTVIVESILKYSSAFIVVVILASTLLNTSFFSNQILRALGLVVFGIGTFIFIIAMVTMRDSWRAGIPENDNTLMVTSGIYRISRNPAFLGFDLTYIGACLAFGNIVLIIFAIFTLIMMHLQILEEEKFLETTFTNEYLIYKNKVSRYFLFF
ncbi:methyltransferase family protein [Anaeromicropila herbilytica]|uniref:Isoprenylcysteine carboxylmethyltransferase family protein n=1 Tax=Anaeromicropila herbilytica TaxID=2785025 RepID=A0A7R7EKZ3_9FIRM|nr:isoprenylcysteine carboxylmethyltransferase family protein [Anaeromicropila herbilytica]BCN30750.1 hypothetical protein bsdtb5_20450 [Anaeromicropila herbilytica]